MAQFLRDLDKGRPTLIKQSTCRNAGRCFEIVKHLIIAANLCGERKLTLLYKNLLDIIVDAYDVVEYESTHRVKVGNAICNFVARLREEELVVDLNDNGTLEIRW